MFYTFNLSCNTSNPTYIDFKIVAHRYAQSISIYVRDVRKKVEGRVST